MLGPKFISMPFLTYNQMLSRKDPIGSGKKRQEIEKQGILRVKLTKKKKYVIKHSFIRSYLIPEPGEIAGILQASFLKPSS